MRKKIARIDNKRKHIQSVPLNSTNVNSNSTNVDSNSTNVDSAIVNQNGVGELAIHDNTMECFLCYYTFSKELPHFECHEFNKFTGGNCNNVVCQPCFTNWAKYK